MRVNGEPKVGRLHEIVFADPAGFCGEGLHIPPFPDMLDDGIGVDEIKCAVWEVEAAGVTDNRLERPAVMAAQFGGVQVQKRHADIVLAQELKADLLPVAGASTKVQDPDRPVMRQTFDEFAKDTGALRAEVIGKFLANGHWRDIHQTATIQTRKLAPRIGNPKAVANAFMTFARVRRGRSG